MSVVAKYLARIELVCADPDGLAEFYRAAFGCGGTRCGVASAGGNFELRLGDQTIRLIHAGPGGRAYPSDVPGWSPLFQHIAIVTGDMERAYAHLRTVPGWTPISNSGPQVLPIASGGVTAFKFRDPEGHPLELIAFPAGAVPPQWQMQSRNICLGIDHSAVSVSRTATSIAFYESLGLNRSAHSLNVGPEQARLDDLAGAVVQITALAPFQITPHVELLCYQGDFDRRIPAQGINDIAATRLVLTIQNHVALEAICARMSDALLSGPELRKDNSCRALLQDPDGHLIWLETAN
jgi:catechol 2,3-dioxygenase-like lactoylglutathione lyase family enzyme